MFRKKKISLKSKSSFTRSTVLFSVLALMLISPSHLRGQESVSFEKPFNRCWEYSPKTGAARIIASDNDSNIVFVENDSTLKSVNLTAEKQNWLTEINGSIKPNIIYDSKNIYLVSRTDNQSQNLISVSLQTGVTNWQVKLGKKSDLEFVETEKLILLKEQDGLLTAIEKDNGNVVWKSNQNNFSFIREAKVTKELKILSSDSTDYLSLFDGQKVKEVRVKEKISADSVSDATFDTGFLFLGYPTGEILKIDENGRLIWKIKLGGGVSNITVLSDGVLATSLDNFVYFFSGSNGKLKWKKRVGGRIISAPLSLGKYILIVNSADSFASVIDSASGRLVNRIQIESDVYFMGVPFLSADALVFQTNRGIISFSNKEC